MHRTECASNPQHQGLKWNKIVTDSAMFLNQIDENGWGQGIHTRSGRSYLYQDRTWLCSCRQGTTTVGTNVPPVGRNVPWFGANAPDAVRQQPIRIKHKFTDLWGNWRLHNDAINTFCEINLGRRRAGGARGRRQEYSRLEKVNSRTNLSTYSSYQ